jgi:hypothetical protein
MTVESYCPVCSSAHADVREDLGVMRIRCRRCGNFEVTESLSEDHPWVMSGLTPYLSAYLRQSSDAGRVARLDDTWETHARSRRRTPVSRKLQLLLKLLAERSQFAGDQATLEPDDFVLVDAMNGEELSFLSRTLVESGLIADVARTGRWVVTAKGWAELTPRSGRGLAGVCFVAMAFDPLLDPAFDDGIKPAVSVDCGMNVVRVDRVQHNGSITDLIIASIRESELVVADMTKHRNGVYFEAGFAMGLGRTVIFSCREDEVKDIHFDTSHYNHIVWKTPSELRKKLASRIRATVVRD